MNMEDRIEIYKQLSICEDDRNLNFKEMKSIIEALLFTSGEPLSIDDISKALQINKKDAMRILDGMIDEYEREKRGIMIISFNNKYQLCTRPEYIEYIKRLINPQSKQVLSRAAIETMAIIAYKQPITRQAIDSIRGVKSDRVLSNLLEKKLIKEVGRLDAPGRPILYGTTDEFLKYFGIKNLSELPKLQDFEIEIDT